MLAQGQSNQPQLEQAIALLTGALAKIHGPRTETTRP
jgi:hypothetical protein